MKKVRSEVGLEGEGKKEVRVRMWKMSDREWERGEEVGDYEKKRMEEMVRRRLEEMVGREEDREGVLFYIIFRTWGLNIKIWEILGTCKNPLIFAPKTCGRQSQMSNCLYFFMPKCRRCQFICQSDKMVSLYMPIWVFSPK